MVNLLLIWFSRLKSHTRVAGAQFGRVRDGDTDRVL